MIYFDSAATTLQKPATVPRAVFRAIGEMATPGRGGHRACMHAANTVYACREALADLFSLTDPSNVVFTHNATHGLNIALKSLVSPGDKVVISGYEHNSATRPLHALGAQVTVAQSSLFSPQEALDAFSATICQNTKLVVCNHVSNVFGYILPVYDIAKLCKSRGVPFVLDASQSAGVLPIDATQLEADFIAMPGHKSLYGPAGTGVLLCKGPPGQTLIEGGTGSSSKTPYMPPDLPDRLEAGTPNTPGIAGLLAGVRYVQKMGVKKIYASQLGLLQKVKTGLLTLPGVVLYAAEDPLLQTAVLSFSVTGFDCEDFARALGEKDIAVRGGFHCSPLAHQSAGTIAEGTIRLSFSSFNTPGEVDKFLHVLKGILAKGV